MTKQRQEIFFILSVLLFFILTSFVFLPAINRKNFLYLYKWHHFYKPGFQGTMRKYSIANIKFTEVDPSTTIDKSFTSNLMDQIKANCVIDNAKNIIDPNACESILQKFTRIDKIKIIIEMNSVEMSNLNNSKITFELSREFGLQID